MSSTPGRSARRRTSACSVVSRVMVMAVAYWLEQKMLNFLAPSYKCGPAQAGPSGIAARAQSRWLCALAIGPGGRLVNACCGPGVCAGGAGVVDRRLDRTVNTSQESDMDPLKGKTVCILVADIYNNDFEFWIPYYRMKEARGRGDRGRARGGRDLQEQGGPSGQGRQGLRPGGRRFPGRAHHSRRLRPGHHAPRPRLPGPGARRGQGGQDPWPSSAMRAGCPSRRAW